MQNSVCQGSSAITSILSSLFDREMRASFRATAAAERSLLYFNLFAVVAPIAGRWQDGRKRTEDVEECFAGHAFLEYAGKERLLILRRRIAPGAVCRVEERCSS